MKPCDAILSRDSIVEGLRRMGVLRSRHPYHPVCAFGAKAEEMLTDHEQSAVPDGPETPYGRSIEWGGWVLLIGWDLDTLPRTLSVAEEHGITLLLNHRLGSCVGSASELAQLLQKIDLPHLRAGCDPSEIAKTGARPFGDVPCRGSLRRFIAHPDVQRVSSHQCAAVPGKGNGEIKEIVSNLRCRSFDGFFRLWPMPGNPEKGFQEAATGCWNMMETL
jgi:hypothetical protein